MKKRGQGKRHRIFAVFLCLCVLFTTQPGIWNRLSVFAAEESETKVVLSFAELSEEIKEQTVPVGTVYEELELPEELNVFMKQTEISSTPNLTEEKSEEETVSGNDPETGSKEEEADVTEQEEYYAESEEITVYTPENSEKEAQELRETVAGVTWQSDPAYDGNIEDTYIFTAVLPESYTLAEDVSLPQITVTVKESESGTDFAIQTLLDRIAALPDAEEYLALEPDMEEDEDAYAEWEEKLYEYAEEALVIWEEYEALTEEQQAQMPEEELAKLTAWVELAETLSESSQVMAIDGSTHTHCVCGGKLTDGEYNHTEEEIVYDNILDSENGQLLLNSNPVTRDEQSGYQLTSGNYYLADDVALNSELVITGGSEVYICLCGHTLSYNRKNGKHRVITVENEAKLNLCTCGDSGSITDGDMTGDAGGGLYLENATLNAYGISINDNTVTAGGGGIALNKGSHCNLYKVNIYNNKGSCGGGIMPFASYLNMYGGEIRGNAITSQFGGGIATGGSAENSILQDVKIYDNTSETYAGGLYWQAPGKTLTMLNVEIFNNNVSNSTARFPAGGVALMQGTISISGTTIISGNQYNGEQNNFWNYCNTSNPSKLVISGDLDEQSVIGLTNRTAPTEDAPAPVEVASGSNHTITDADWSRFFSDKKEYKIVKDGNALFLALPDTCDLSGLDLTAEGAELEPNFQADIITYEATVGSEVDTVGITATLAGSTDGKTIKIKNGTVLSEKEIESGRKEDVDLDVGLNTIVITVTSGGDTKTYTLNITREAPVSYIITYELDGGTAADNPDSYTSSDDAITLNNPTKEGYTFIGWSGTGLDGENNMTVTIPKGSIGNREYTAHWEAETYTVTLNGDGGTGTALTGYTYGIGATLPTDWTKTGYDFAGWYDNKNFTGTAVTKILTTDTGDKTFWAKWTSKTYQVKFEYHGATGGDTTASKNVTYGSTYGDLPVPTRTGYTFKGWYTETDGKGTEVNAGTTVTTASAHTLHAHWLDETPPDKPVLQDGVILPAGWTNNQTTIPLKLYDGVGVISLLVSVDGSSYTEVSGFSSGTGSMTYDYPYVQEGEHKYQFKAVDEADNFAESDIFTVKLDRTKPVIGTLTYENKAKDFLDWIIGKKSMIIHVPVTDTGSGVTEISYTMTPRDAAGNLDESKAVEKKAAVKDGEAKITFDKDFRGTITINCTDRAGNAADSVTIGTAGAGGVIVEDTSPDITTDAKTDYYDTPTEIHVTVKDDTQNAIAAGIATVKYKVGDGTEQSVTASASALQAEITFTIPAAQIPTGIAKITVTATDNAGNEAIKSFPVKVKGPEKTPAAEIDCREEELAKFVPGEKYSIDGMEYTADQEGRIPIEGSWFGTTVSIVKKGNGSETTDSPAQSLSVPARPQRPTPTGVDVSTAGGTGKLTGLTAGTTYEVSTDDGKTWVSHTADGNGEITGLAPGTYVVRVKAGDANFVSEPSDSVKIGAYQIKVTFMVDGAKYEEITVDYGAALTDIPPVPAKDNAIGVWCMDRQGTTPAVFTNITADMTVYAVYTTAYTVTLQTGTGYTLSAQGDSESPVKEGGSFTFRFALADGYQRNADFAVKVNGVKVELAADGIYTISDIRENKTVTVEGIAKKPGGKPSSSGGGDKEDDPAPTQPPSEPSGDTPSTPPVDRPAKVTPPAPGISSPAAEKEPEGRQPGTTPRQEKGGGTEKKGETETETASIETGALKAGSTDERVAGSADVGQTEKEAQAEKREVQIGNGTVIVTVVCEEEKCTATVADTEKVVKAVLTPDQQELVNGGGTIEIRIDVTDISGKVPAQDKEVIESGIEAYREEVPGLVLGMYVDISMFIKIGAGDWNAITATDEPVEVVIDIPEKLLSDGREFYIIRAHNGEYTFMNDLDDVPDTITVSTDLFSSYAIAYMETEGAGADSGAKCGLCHICPTFLGICYFIWLVIIIALVLVIYLIIRRRRQEEKNEKQKKKDRIK